MNTRAIEFPTRGRAKDCALFADVLLTEVQQNGYALVDAHRCSEDPLLELSSFLGTRQLHARANEQGLVGYNEDEIDPTWRDYRREYRGVGNEEFELHTDGAFIHGPGVDRPIAIMLHCVEPAVHGGVTLLVDGQSIYRHGYNRDPGLFTELRKSQFSFCRDNMVAANQPIFADVNYSRVGIRWRFDQTVYGSLQALDVMRTFHTEYIARSAPDLEVRLDAGQVLVIDNTRMLHARTGSAGLRQMRRTWIADPTVAAIENLHHRLDTPRGMLPFRTYAKSAGEFTGSTAEWLFGIKLDGD
jgi:hypothetical protein